jgi:hypothetical protein
MLDADLAALYETETKKLNNRFVEMKPGSLLELTEATQR